MTTGIGQKSYKSNTGEKQIPGLMYSARQACLGQVREQLQSMLVASAGSYWDGDSLPLRVRGSQQARAGRRFAWASLICRCHHPHAASTMTRKPDFRAAHLTPFPVQWAGQRLRPPYTAVGTASSTLTRRLRPAAATSMADTCVMGGLPARLRNSRWRMGTQLFCSTSQHI